MGLLMQQDPVRRLNRQARRRAMRETGHTWASARALARRQEREAAMEAKVAAAAYRMTPEQARKALAEWAARGGK